MDTKKTRSTAPARTPSTTPAPAPNRASQAAQARAATGPRPAPKPAPAPAPQNNPPVADRVDVDNGGQSQAGGLMSGLSANFHPSGDWGDGYLGINGNSVQFGLNTPNTQIHGAGETNSGFRNGSAFAEGNFNGVINDKPFDASGGAKIQLGPHFDAVNQSTQNPDGSTTWKARLVVPTPFGFSLGGGFNVTYGGE
jgi:hypothetical protein